MKKILIIFLLLISIGSNAQVLSANFTYTGRIIFRDTCIAFTKGGDTLRIGVRNGYAYLECLTCDSFHFVPPLPLGSGTLSGGLGEVLFFDPVTGLVTSDVQLPHLPHERGEFDRGPALRNPSSGVEFR